MCDTLEAMAARCRQEAESNDVSKTGRQGTEEQILGLQ